MFYFFSGSYLSYILSCCNAFTCFHAVSESLLFTHTCPVTEFAVASHLNTANSSCHQVFLRHFRFQKCLPVYSNSESARFYFTVLSSLPHVPHGGSALSVPAAPKYPPVTRPRFGMPDRYLPVYRDLISVLPHGAGFRPWNSRSFHPASGSPSS